MKLVERGSFKVIRVDGSEQLFDEKPTLAKVHRAIGCECFDTVILDRKREIVMLVDDTGAVDNKPINRKATALYHSVCFPGNPYSIHGDVAIVCDGDFE